MIQATKQPDGASRSLASADPAWSCRWCDSHSGVRVLDAGFQTAVRSPSPPVRSGARSGVLHLSW